MQTQAVHMPNRATLLLSKALTYFRPTPRNSTVFGAQLSLSAFAYAFSSVATLAKRTTRPVRTHQLRHELCLFVSVAPLTCSRRLR